MAKLTREKLRNLILERMYKMVNEIEALEASMGEDEYSEKAREVEEKISGKVRDMEGFKRWLMDKYFGPQHSSKPWYKPGITVDNVLGRLMDKDSPISLKGAVEVWNSMPFLKRGLEALGDEELLKKLEMGGFDDEDLEKAEEELEDQKPVMPTKYHRSELDTESELAKEFGVTKQMIHQIAVNAMNKIRRLTGGVDVADMTPEQLKTLKGKIAAIRNRAADEYSHLLKTFADNIDRFFDALLTKQIIGPSEVEKMKEEESEALSHLATKPVEDIKEILLTDIEEDDNLFKSFQNYVAKTLIKMV